VFSAYGNRKVSARNDRLELPASVLTATCFVRRSQLIVAVMASRRSARTANFVRIMNPDSVQHPAESSKSGMSDGFYRVRRGSFVRKARPVSRISRFGSHANVTASPS